MSKYVINIVFLGLILISCDKHNKGINVCERAEPNCQENDSDSICDFVSQVNIDTLIGHFRCFQLDTLICKGYDNRTVRIFSPSNNIGSLTIKQVYGIYIVKEGDLDNNGTEEIGIRTEDDMGHWREYSVYTINKEGNWMYLIPPIITYSFDFYQTLSKGKDVVKPSKKKRFVDVKFSRFQDDDICLLDTTIKVNPQPLDKLEEIGEIY